MPARITGDLRVEGVAQPLREGGRGRVARAGAETARQLVEVDHDRDARRQRRVERGRPAGGCGGGDLREAVGGVIEILCPGPR